MPRFAAGLARVRSRVARRFPWIDAYTPVNEPLTTARFSALYGHWYPHGRDDRSFVARAAQPMRATVLAMHAIRAVNSARELVQTDDLGTMYGTPRLAYQADFDNERRWLGWDLLCGRVDARASAARATSRGAGIDARELEWFNEHPCPPDIIGINHYVTSDRFLDERLDRYPRRLRGGNGRDRVRRRRGGARARRSPARRSAP